MRNVTDCDDIIETGVLAAKADFSWDGRYIAYHAPKPDASGYEIQVLDLERRSVRRVTDLPGSSFFPSGTADGRLSFRYDSADYHGFLMASDVLAAEEVPLAAAIDSPEHVLWEDFFADAAIVANRGRPRLGDLERALIRRAHGAPTVCIGPLARDEP